MIASQIAHVLVDNLNKKLLTSLTVVVGPAAFTEVPIEGGRLAGGLSDCRPWTHIAALSVILVGHDVVVLHRVQDLGPVQGGEIAEIRVLLNSHSSSGDVHQTVKADLAQLEHLKHNQGIVEEEVVASDDRQVGEEFAKAL